jgi:signal transduction histidine kinase/ligand-binding sensor domain-containing protein/AraC-like DNA-binding protein
MAQMRVQVRFFTFILIQILFLSHQTFPQKYNPENKINFTPIFSESKFDINFIWCVVQDIRGFLWIGSADGIYRYDGVNFKYFNHSDEDGFGLSSGNVKTLFIDHLGELWIGTSGGGLNRYNYDKENFTKYIHNLLDSTSISSNTILTIFEDKNKGLWIGTENGGLNLFNREKNNFINFRHDPLDETSLSSNKVSCIYEDTNGFLWIGTLGGGLNKFDRTSNKFSRYSFDYNDNNSLSNDIVTGICEDKFGSLWISTLGGGLNRLKSIGSQDQIIFERYTFNPKKAGSISNNNISTLYLDKDDVLWIGTWDGGLNILIPNENKNSSPMFSSYKHDPFNEKSIKTNNVVNIYEDNSGLIWISSWGGGLQFINKKQKQFRTYKFEPNSQFSLSDDAVSAVYEDKTVTLWVGTWNGGLNKLDKESNKFIYFKNNPKKVMSISDNAVAPIYEDNSGVFWVGTWQGGLNQFDRETGKFYTFRHDPKNRYSISDDRIVSIIEDKEKILWIGTYYGGLNKFDKKIERFISFKNEPDNPNSLSADHVSSLCLDDSGSLWIGTKAGGLNTYDYSNNKFIHYKNDPKNFNSISNDKITFLYWSLGVLWIGTENGLNKFSKKNGRFKRYEIRDGLPSNYICGILEDDHQNLWISTSHGISKFNIEKETFRNYDVSDGLQGNEFEENGAAFKSKTGELIFGGAHGLNIFYPDSILDNSHIPPVYITDFKLFNNSVPIGFDSLTGRTILKRSIIDCEEIKLNYSDKVFTFEFAALDFQVPLKNKYAYIMEGFDKDWNYTDAIRNLATYTNLDPGEYIFRVKGSNNDGIWNEEGASLKIIILPPWWRTIWAYIFYSFLILSIIYFTWKTQLKRIRVRHEFEMSKFETQKLHEVDELKSRFFTNISHEFRTPLTLILGPVKQMIERTKDQRFKDDLSMVHRNAYKLIELVNELLDISKLESGNMKLQTVPQNIIPLLKAMVLSFSSYAERKQITLQFNYDVDEIIVYLDKDKFEKIINNILSNAFKFTPNGGKVEVSARPKHFSFPHLVKGDSIEIIIADTGIGILKEKLSKIFDRFYQVDSSHTREQEGTGIGLALTKELIDLHKGTINVESEEGRGTTVTVNILLGTEHLKPDEIIEQIEKQEHYKPKSLEHTIQVEGIGEDHKIIYREIEDDSLPLLLIVEDNADVRKYIKDNLDSEFRIIEAKDGDDGWNKSVENIPDLIVSDVMMPKMDGFKFCEKLKIDERTSHIPVILLTAKAAKQDKLDGYELGADEYILKPFETDELKARIKNLIQQRERIHQHFKEHGLIELNLAKITATDKKFLKSVYESIINNISDSNFSIEHLAEKINISRSVLQRKVVSLTGEKPGELIRRVRINKAAELIKKRFGNLSEIALEVGFNNPAYFSEVFKKQFGVTPSQYQHKFSNS